jgi:Na+-transporting methylmalonyl-CoA/oxaloacetate decarboxylase gamma subunit
MVALVLTVVFIVVVGAVAFHAWKEEDEKSETSAPVEPAAVARPETLEGVMVAQLSAGEISRRQYLRAMERIAARDDERHPLTVPRDTA